MTAPHYGKRNLGLGTAASPGDTLHFNFASYNDSGDSEVLTGLAITDIEVIKDGSATVRATDSGYSLISDTGMVGDRAGLYRCRIQLFNTADDASFYANGSWYQAFVDAVTIDGKTVRFWLGSWEIGEPRANIVQLGGDTGALGWLKSTFASGFADTGLNQRFAQIQSDVDTGLRVHIDDSDTGIKDAIADLDTGLRDFITDTDTGVVAGVWEYATRTLTANTNLANLAVNVTQIGGDTGAAGWLKNTFASGFADTGINDHLGRIRSDVDTGLRTHIDDLDTGLANLNVNLHMIRGDTGGADRFYRYTQKLDTGGDATVSSSVDTGVVNQAVWQGNATRVLTANTNLANLAVNVTQVVGDTGAGVHLKRLVDEYDTGRLAAEASATLDTGAVNQAVWQANAQRKLTVDTGIADQVWMQLTADYAADTGTFGELLRVPATATVDTGQVNQAVWQGNATRVLTANTNLSGLAVSVTAFSDTGVQNRLDKIASDTDTGIKDGVWDSATRTLTANTNLGGLSVNVTQLGGDTGALGWLKSTFASGFADTGLNSRFAQVTVTGFSDTGVNERLAALETGVNVTSFADTGINNRLDKIASDTDTGIKDGVWDSATRTLTANTNLSGLQVNVTQIDSDTGAADQLGKAFATTPSYFQQVDVQQIDGDTGAANQLEVAFAGGFHDTGINDRLARILADTDTGIQGGVNVTGFADTGVNDRLARILADTDTGIQSSVNVTSFADTGVNNRLAVIAADTDTGIQSSVTATNVTGFADTGVNQRLAALQTGVNVTSFADTGVNDRLARILADTDTGIQGGVHVVSISDTGINSRFAQVTVTGFTDTGINERLDAIETKTNSLTFTVANQVDANIQSVNDVTVAGTGASGDRWRPA